MILDSCAVPTEMNQEYHFQKPKLAQYKDPFWSKRVSHKLILPLNPIKYLIAKVNLKTNTLISISFWLKYLK